MYMAFPDSGHRVLDTHSSIWDPLDPLGPQNTENKRCIIWRIKITLELVEHMQIAIV